MPVGGVGGAGLVEAFVNLGADQLRVGEQAGDVVPYRYYTCFTRNRYGTDHCNAPRIEAEPFDDIVLAAVGDFYRIRTDLVTQAITAAQDDYRATKAAVAAELSTVTSSLGRWSDRR